MAVSGRKQKNRRAVLEKKLFQTARRHGAGKILRLFIYFSGRITNPQKSSFHRDKNKARQASCFDRQEQ